MELKYLNTFKVILETGSFQQAAKHLNYAQSTITLQMQLLEQELSVKLFERIGRKMKLTPAGHELIPYIDHVLDAVEKMKNYGKCSPDLTGTLRIAIPETLLTYKMPPILKQFRQKAPNVTLSIQSPNCYDIQAQVINGGTDLGIHYDVGNYGVSVITEPLRQYEFVFVGSAELSTEERDFITPNQQKKLCLLADQSSYYYKKAEEYLQTNNIRLENKMNLVSTETIKQLVRGNLGVAYLPLFSVENELKAGSLLEIPTNIQEKCLNTVCTYHKNKWVTPAMELFLQLLHSEERFSP